MTVKVRKQLSEFGVSYTGTVYLPESSILTKKELANADTLDLILKRKVGEINKSFGKLSPDIKSDPLQKWKWLGGKIDALISGTPEIERKDIDENSLWPAIGQYLRDELQRGDDEKRSASPKDHYRKCWILATVGNIEWITSWSSWDALADRGDQIIASSLFMKVLSRTLASKVRDFDTKKFQILGKLITKHFPSQGNRPVQINRMSEGEIGTIVARIVGDLDEVKEE